jgi:WD40 repeat protein
MKLTKHWAATLGDYVIDLAWSPDCAVLAAASTAGPISLFASTDGKLLHELPGHEEGTNAVAFAPPATTILASAGQDGAVKFWDPAAGQHIASAALDGAWVEHIAWMLNTEGGGPKAEGRRILAAAAGRTLVLLNPDGSLQHTFKPAPKTITALAWSPPSPLAPRPSPILAVAYFGGVCLWNTGDGLAAKEYAYANGIQALAWSPDGRWLVSGNQDPSVHLWIPAENEELHMSGYENKVKHLSFDHTGRWLATSGGRDVSVWDCSGAGPEGREPLMFPHDAPVCSVAFQNTHGLLASASEDGVVMLWSPERKQPLRATIKMPTPATRLSWSPDDSLLAIGNREGTVYVLKAEG